MLLCADAAGAAAALAGGQLACPCGQGRLARWGHARPRVITLAGGARARLQPVRARCRACGRTQVSLASVMGSGAISVIWLPGVMDDAFAEKVEAGAAVHLPLDCFEPVDVAFGGS